MYVDDLCFLLRSPLFLYAISPRLTTPSSPSTILPPTPKSMTSDMCDTIFEVTHLEIRVKSADDSCVAQLSYGDNVLLEGRQLDVEQEARFVQSIFWFCEEASFLAYEYKAREHAWAVRMGEAVDVEPLMEGNMVKADGPKMLGRSKGRDNRRALKLKIRFRDTKRGPAGVWRVE